MKEGKLREKRKSTSTQRALKLKCEDITHQRSNRWCKKLTRPHWLETTPAALPVQRNLRAGLQQADLEIFNTFPPASEEWERTHKRQMYDTHATWSTGGTIEWLVWCTGAGVLLCVPGGSCSALRCGSAWSSPRPRWCRTARRVYSRSQSVARWTPLL